MDETENTDRYSETRDEKGRFSEGNPGKPKGAISLTAIIKRKLIELRPDGDREAIEHLADNIIQDALDNNDRMRELIWNYVDGKPKQAIDLNQVDGFSEDTKDIYED